MKKKWHAIGTNYFITEIIILYFRKFYHLCLFFELTQEMMFAKIEADKEAS